MEKYQIDAWGAQIDGIGKTVLAAELWGPSQQELEEIQRALEELG